MEWVVCGIFEKLTSDHRLNDTRNIQLSLLKVVMKPSKRNTVRVIAMLSVTKVTLAYVASMVIMGS